MSAPPASPTTAGSQGPRPRPPGDAQPPPIAGNVVWRLLGTGFRMAIALLSVPLYTRLIGMSQWGMLILFQAAAAPIALLDLGIGQAMVKRVSEALGRGDEEGASRTVRAALFFMGAVLIVGAAALFALSTWFAGSVFAIDDAYKQVAARGFRIVALSWAASAILGFCSNVLVAAQRYDQVLRASTVAIVATTGAGLVAATTTRDASWVLLAQAGGTLTAAAFAFRQVCRVLPRVRAGIAWDWPEIHRLLHFGVPQTVASLGTLLSGWSDRYVLGISFAPRTLGFYGLAQSLQQQIYTVFFEAGEVLFPAVSHRHGAGDVAGALRLALLAGWALTTGFGPIAITLGVVGGDFLSIWISPEAAIEATNVLRLLCAAGIAGLAGVAPIFYAMGSGRSHWQAPFALAMGIVFAAASVILAPRYGLLGIGFALLAANGVRWLLLLILGRALFRPEFGGRHFALHVFAPPLVSLAMLACGAPLHDSIGHTQGWIALVGEAAAVLFVAALAQVALGEILPGGRARRMDVIHSFRPAAVRAFERLSRNR